MEALDFQRKTEKRSNMQTVGVGSASTLYGLRGVSATEEQRIMQLQAFAAYRLPLQDPATGNPYFVPGIDTPGDPNRPIR